MNHRKIIINGREYRDISEVPKEFRHLFEDKNNNGIPDIVEGHLKSGQMDFNIHGNMEKIEGEFIDISNQYEINGKMYKSLDEIPPEFRGIFEDKDGDGVPDLLQSKGGKGKFFGGMKPDNNFGAEFTFGKTFGSVEPKEHNENTPMFGNGKGNPNTGVRYRDPEKSEPLGKLPLIFFICAIVLLGIAFLFGIISGLGLGK